MKSLFTILLAIAFLVGCAGVNTNTPKETIVLHDGELNPNDFNSWTVVKGYRCTAGHIHAIVKNPDATHPIQQVELILGPSSKNELDLLGYTYEKDDVIYLYVFDRKQNKYVQKLPKITGV
uniref:Lipoprotein n=1 Tax=viral metagenome TaxID=1070528 RepID=A0A6H1ZIF5_9ZZZZ